MNRIKLSKFLVTFSALATLTMGDPARADSSETARFTLTVPLRCSVETLSLSRVEEGRYKAELSERCNDGRGYAVYLDHPAGIVRSVEYDGRAVAVGTTQTLLRRTSRSGNAESSLNIHVEDDAPLSVRIVPASG